MTFLHPDGPDWQPPSGFTPIESALPGITVYAPIIEKESEPAPQTYKCPNCGASTNYDVAAGGVACEYCGFVAETRAEELGKRAEEFEFSLETLQVAEQGWGVARQELHCDSCGANLSIEPGALTTTCPFCASNRVNIRQAPADVLRPRALIPFKVQAADISQRAREWLGKGWFHPDELRASAVIERFTGIYLPFWTFDADIHSLWRAQVGYQRQESYYDASDKSWKTRTVIDWRWEDGQVSIHNDDLLISGSARLSHRILERLYPFNLNELAAYNPDFLAGWQAQTYDISLPQAWEDGKTTLRERAKDACYQDIPTSHVRNFSMTADFANEVWRFILLPVYVAAYRYQDRVFQVMVNGQNGVVAGQKPVAWWKIWLATAGLLAPGLLLGLISLPLVLVGGVGMLPLILGIVLLVIGAAIAFTIYRQAVASEAD
jgi:uncharacterized Zn finger protein (UPF0148 family)